ncbi:uncharacterized protein LOC129754472 [Uranotaenia lowii]|uniref:uncharacterized protein LOC129754472 n=1 Tax=Uranotaenia lowii TaxID=190385 RepID=UPI00247A8E92|nr:uncharacterized protein LOC129754472 [Uranotaenia lowii]
MVMKLRMGREAGTENGYGTGSTSCRMSLIMVVVIGVGLTGKVSASALPELGGEGDEISPSQEYFDAVPEEDREAFLKYHLDKALEERIDGHISITPADFTLNMYYLSSPEVAFSRNKPETQTTDNSHKSTTFAAPLLAPKSKALLKKASETGDNCSCTVDDPSQVKLTCDMAPGSDGTGQDDGQDGLNQAARSVKYSLVCHSSGCIEPDDIGNICCPF